MASLTLVFVHGYSVTNLNTYGELPQRLKNEAAAYNHSITIQDLFLARYISFNDEVQLSDLAKAFQHALKVQIPSGSSFICITHSTGAPIVRTWLHLYYANQERALCPLSHLIMLAPANHGSALAQLGKGRLSRIKSWFDQVEPGQKILNWLELGSYEAWQLNKAYIHGEAAECFSKNVFPFVLCGQDIDRKLYDHLNSYTGEVGSDGVVRLASANLNSAYLTLEQSTLQIIQGKASSELVLTSYTEAPKTALRILSRRSHSGDKMGIVKSIRKDSSDEDGKETIRAIFDCIAVRQLNDYNQLCERFNSESSTVQTSSALELEQKPLKQNQYIHDRCAMVIFKLVDSDGNTLGNFDLIFTTGPDKDPDALPNGFIIDRQKNHLDQSSLTYYFNYDLMMGSKEIAHEGEIIRKATNGISSLGIRIRPRPDEGFVRYLPCEINPSAELMKKMIRPNATTMVHISLFRIVSSEALRFEKTTNDDPITKDFKHTQAGSDFVV